MKQARCEVCSGRLNNTEMALNLKLRGRAVSTFFCLSCMSGYMDCTPGELMEMAAFFRENGCELFQRVYVDEGGEEQGERMAMDPGA